MAVERAVALQGGPAVRGGPVVVGAYLGAVALAVAAITATNGGVFSYTLDDPYVHLELARHLAEGEHGINRGTFAAPASSVLWPALLVPAWLTGGAFFAPLLLNVLSGLLALGGFVAAGRRILGEVAAGRAATLLLLAMLLIGNLVALTLAGMEHTLQVAVAAWLAVALIDVDAGRRPPVWLVPAAVLLPLLRFEGTGIVLLSAAWLAWRGHRWHAAGIVATIGGILAAYAGFLHARSGFWLPFSVLSKNDMFVRAIYEAYLPAVFLPLLLSGWMLARAVRRPSGAWELPAIAAAGVAGHVLIAQAGLFHRYLGYVTVFLVLVLAWSEREALRAALRQGGPPARIVGWVALILATVNVKLTVDALGAAQHIWRQQGQLRRIAVEVVDGPVAVNDIGWVSLGNEHEVVDLVGLATPEALRHRLAGDPVQWMDDLVQARGVRAIMIFPHWFPELPRGWVHVATLQVERSSFAEADRVVHVLAPTREAAGPLREALTAFAPTLPDGVRLRIERRR